jgi:hypothetical protein
LLLVLHLRYLPPTLDISRRFRQAARIPFSQLSGLALLCKLALKEGNLLDKAFNNLVSRGQCRGVLRLHSRNPLPCLLLCQGGPVFHIFDAKGGAIPRHSNLLGPKVFAASATAMRAASAKVAASRTQVPSTSNIGMSALPLDRSCRNTTKEGMRECEGSQRHVGKIFSLLSY